MLRESRRTASFTISGTAYGSRLKAGTTSYFSTRSFFPALSFLRAHLRRRRQQFRLQAAEAALAAVEGGQRFRKMRRAEIRPHRVGEMQLGVGALPQQEVGQPLFAAGADDEVDVAQSGLAGDEFGKPFAAEFAFGGGLRRGIQDRVARGIVHRDAQMQHIAARGGGFGAAEGGS